MRTGHDDDVGEQEWRGLSGQLGARGPGSEILVVLLRFGGLT
jgi:hypothetical protein